MPIDDKRLQAILDAMPLKFFLKDSSNRIVLANKAVADSLNVTVADLEGSEATKWYPDEAGAYYQADLEVMKSGEPKLGILEALQVDDGDKHWVIADKHPYRDESGEVVGVLVFIRDATEQAKVEAALRESEDRLQATNAELERVLESVSDYLWSIAFDSEGTPIHKYYSPVVEQITGRPPEYYQGGVDRWQSTVHPDDRADMAQAVSLIVSGSVSSLTRDYRIILPDGAVRWVRDSVTSKALAGGGLQLDGVVSDITEAKLAELEHLKWAERSRHSQKLESLGVLAGGIAHDFNNILTTVLGYAGLAELDLPVDSRTRTYTTAITAAGQQAAAICKQMLAYSGKGHFTVKSIGLSALAREVTQMLKISVSKKAELRFNLEEDLPAIKADAGQIQQVAMNLITNASESLGGSKGVISLRTGLVECDRDYLSSTYMGEELRAGPYVYLKVSDTGCGMDEDTIEKIFDPFFTTKFAGRGLGMAAVLGIVRGHHAAIEVSSKPGQGSTFTVLFPASETRNSDESDNEGLNEAWRGQGTVLVVDDEAAVRNLAKHALERFGFDVVTAADGIRGIEAFRERAGDILFVLLDLTMPQLGGDEVFLELRRIDPNVTVVLSSGYNAQVAVADLVGKGLAGFLQKPYTPQELVSKVRQVLGNVQ